MKSFLAFFWAALKNPLQVSTVFATGPTAAQSMVAGIPTRDVVVELGVGTGAITTAIVAKVGNPLNYLGIELNPDMIEFARERFPELRFINDSAENFANYLGDRKVSAVISSLPWTVMPPAVVAKTLDEVYARLEVGGVFATYLTLHVLKTPAGRRFQAKLHEKFESLDSKVVLENLPPVKTFIARK
jgi:phosphatidylethanolamine/phosphatidyl-N-methylethanolamine N-methyltransferase